MSARTPDMVFDMATAATSAIEAVIAHGAEILVAEPWRADRVFRGASHMTAREVELTCNRLLGHCRDTNRALALLQLRRAGDSPEWGPAWAQMQEAR